MSEPQGIATTRRRLRTELRRLREAAGLNQAQVVEELDWSTSKLIRIENGSVGVSVTDVRALLGVYDAPAETIDGLVKLARVTRERQWWSKYRAILSPMYREFLGYEADATALHQFHPTLIPGLLQTADYIREVLVTAPLTPFADDVRQSLFEVRIHRQDEIVRSANPPDYAVIIDEGALRRVVGGPALMKAQLEYLASLDLPHVTISVMPLSAGAHVGVQGAFHVMEFANEQDESVVFLETAVGNPVEREPTQVAQYAAAFDNLLSRATGGDAARDMIRTIARELR